MKLTEEELKTIECALSVLAGMKTNDLRNLCGSILMKDILELEGKFRYRDYCERHGVKFEELTDDDFMREYYERYEC